MTVVMEHVASKTDDDQVSSWGTQHKNAQKAQGHTEVPTQPNIEGFPHQTHEANRHKTSAATKKRKQLIADSLLLKQDWLDAPLATYRKRVKVSASRLLSATIHKGDPADSRQVRFDQRGLPRFLRRDHLRQVCRIEWQSV